MDSESSGSSSSSDSDEVLEEVTFLSKSDQRRSHPPTPIKSISQQKENAQIIGNKLDKLLSHHREEVKKDEIHQKIKSDLLHSMEEGSQEDSTLAADTSLNGEFAEHIEQLEVAAPELLTDHPSMTVFNPDKFCCLFKDNINPFSCGFSRSHFSKIDKVFATFRSDNLIPLLMSNTLPSCFHQVSSPHCIMMWLFSLLSIHPSLTAVRLISHTMKTIIHDMWRQHEDDKGSSIQTLWSPKPIEITRILVNMGANPSYLLGDQALYSSDEIKEHLSVENDENDSMPARSPGRLKIENFRSVLEVLTKCFRTKPDYTREEIHLMVCLVIRLSVDASFQNLELHHVFQELLSSLLECSKDSDWLWMSGVPSLCHELATVPQHHTCCTYVVDLMPLSRRGNYVRTRLSYLFLCSMMDDQPNNESSILQLDHVSPSRICQLGGECVDSYPTTAQPSRLYLCLHRLTKEDISKMNSAVTLLDRAVGDEINRNAHPKAELEFLTNQVKMVIRDIRDSIKTLDLSKVKDRMTIMTKKWMLMSSQNTKSVQRSIFSWVTSRANVPEEKLKDNVPTTADEGMDL